VPRKVSFIHAMRSQPENLEVAYRSIHAALDVAEIVPWQPRETVAIIAMGASHHSGNALVAVLAQAGVRAVNIVASDLELAAPGYQPADHYVIVSESGRSPEPLAAARSLTAGRRIGITDIPDAQIAEVLDVVVGLGGFDDSPVYTVGYTATLLAYALLLDRVGVRPEGAQLASVPQIVAKALQRYDRIAATIGRIAADASMIDAVGRGTSFASAAEAALLFREGLRVPSGSFETYQYLHGPMESAGKGTLLLLFGDGREITVPDSVLDAGVQVVLVTATPEQEIPSAGHENLTIVPLDPELDGFIRPIVEIVLVQLILAHASEHKPFLLEEFLFEQHDTKLIDQDEGKNVRLPAEPLRG
jgi:glucosamine--fructose-6-phosphate aminotransferase (isomerizing)